MSLNNIQLNAQLLTSLYSNVLVASDATVVPDKDWKQLGGNRKNILIVTVHENKIHLPDEELQFLISILKACQLSLADVCIINMAGLQEQDYKSITEHFNSQSVLLFDRAPLQFGLPVHFPFFQIQRFDQCVYLSAPALADIEKDTELKKQLWASLKKLFSL